MLPVLWPFGVVRGEREYVIHRDWSNDMVEDRMSINITASDKHGYFRIKDVFVRKHFKNRKVTLETEPTTEIKYVWN